MSKTIQTYQDLEDFLASLTPDQKKQPIRALALSDSGINTIEPEITEEPFLENRIDQGDVGYKSELQRQHGPDFDINDYNVIEPVGTIILNMKSE